MTVEVEISNRQAFFPITNEIEDIIKKAVNVAFISQLADTENKYDEIEVCVSLVESEEIAEINKEFRERAEVTDVLSFPMSDYPEEPMPQNPENSFYQAGDIIICVERAISQANDYGHGLKRELAFLCVHSVLHLLGYDHINEEDEKEMFALQKEILEDNGFVKI